MRDVFVTVLGLAPAVVTETLWALARREPDPFIAREVHVLTTGPGMRDAYATLVGEEGGIARLAGDLGIGHRIDVEVHAIRNRRGIPVEDVRELEESIAVGDNVVERLARLTDQPDCRLHASIAGGRKTMGFYLGYLMSLFGRPQDELSHVLVNPARYEQRDSGFWYPTAETPDARIDLCMIPFVRLGTYLRESERTRLRGLSYREVVALVDEAVQPPRLIVHDPVERSVTAGRRRFELPNREYAMYRLLAETAARSSGNGDGWLGVDVFTTPSSAVVQRFLAIHDATFKTGTAAHVGFNNRIRTAQRKDKPQAQRAAMRQIFNEVRSGLDDILEREIPDAMVRQPYAVHRKERGKGQPARFGLILKAEQIEVEGA
jgi:CRISPR-associated protein (TIGR02584 family)